MAKLTTPEFLDYLTRSGLVEEDDLNRSLDGLRRRNDGEFGMLRRLLGKQPVRWKDKRVVNEMQRLRLI